MPGSPLLPHLPTRALGDLFLRQGWMRDAGFGMRDSGCGIWDSGHPQGSAGSPRAAAGHFLGSRFPPKNSFLGFVPPPRPGRTLPHGLSCGGWSIAPLLCPVLSLVPCHPQHPRGSPLGWAGGSGEHFWGGLVVQDRRCPPRDAGILWCLCLKARYRDPSLCRDR